MNREDKVLVSVICDVFNHGPYLEKCLEGFVLQKTNFPFEVLIHDDASTDNSQEIIRNYEKKYPYIIKSIYQKENKYSQGISIWQTYQFPRVKGKYIALCEGDDYWIDPYKLQKQVDILESDKSIGLVYTNYYQLINSTNKLMIGTSTPINSFDELILNNKVATLTTCFRKSILEEYISNVSGYLVNLSLGDYPTWLYFAIKSKLFFLSETTSVYRVLEESASHSKDISKCLSFAEDVYKVRVFYIERYINSQIKKDELLELVSYINTHRKFSLLLDYDCYEMFKYNSKDRCLLKRYNKKKYYMYLMAQTKIGWMILRKLQHLSVYIR